MNRLRGVALITALLITALAGSVAAGLAWDNALDVRRTMVMLYRDQAIQVAVGSESWVASILKQDGIEGGPGSPDHLDEIWATEIPALPIDSEAVQGQIWGQIEDLSGRFNINNLVDDDGEFVQKYVDQYRRLLQALGLDERLVDATVDWLDKDQQERMPDGAEDPLYSSLIPAYRTADRRVTNVTELAAVAGMDRVSFEILLPHITALPLETPLNVNTATVPVLMSLNDNIDLGTAEGLVEVREGGGFVDYRGTFDTIVHPDLQQDYAESSDYFQLKAVVQIDTVRITLFTVFIRDPSTREVSPLLRRMGTI
ncbi:MAG: type II secretion system minor pseudopilin GspK [Woeseiaceae bacterium]|nr:type II secretion system minor pseudopilin GspK [Woeseiaceae bacterium]